MSPCLTHVFLALSVASRYILMIFTFVAVVLVHDAVEDPVPAGGGGHLEKQDHALTKGSEVVNLVQRPAQLHVHEEAHSEDGKDEHDKEE